MSGYNFETFKAGIENVFVSNNSPNTSYIKTDVVGQQKNVSDGKLQQQTESDSHFSTEESQNEHWIIIDLLLVFLTSNKFTLLLYCRFSYISILFCSFPSIYYEFVLWMELLDFISHLNVFANFK